MRLRQAVAAPTLAGYYEVSLWEMNRVNPAWNPVAQTGRVALPAGTLVWLPAGSVARLAQRGMAGQALALADPVATARPR